VPGFDKRYAWDNKVRCTIWTLEGGGRGRGQLLSVCWMKPRSEDKRHGAQITYS